MDRRCGNSGEYRDRIRDGCAPSCEERPSLTADEAAARIWGATSCPERDGCLEAVTTEPSGANEMLWVAEPAAEGWKDTHPTTSNPSESLRKHQLRSVLRSARGLLFCSFLQRLVIATELAASE